MWGLHLQTLSVAIPLRLVGRVCGFSLPVHWHASHCDRALWKSALGEKRHKVKLKDVTNGMLVLCICATRSKLAVSPGLPQHQAPLQRFNWGHPASIGLAAACAWAGAAGEAAHGGANIFQVVTGIAGTLLGTGLWCPSVVGCGYECGEYSSRDTLED